MPGATSINISSRQPLRATGDSLAVRTLLIGATLAFFLLFLFFPLVVVFQGAFSKGGAAFLETFRDPYTRHSILLTLVIAAISVPLNTVFGIAAAWCVTRYRFRGRSFLITLIDLPLWVSPVIAGLLYVLVFGAQGWFGPWLREHEIRIIFAVPGMVLATIFVTFPFVARGLIPLMQAQGMKEEEAALTLGANSWQILWRITLPKIKWGLLYGIILCNARAMGEFGAVSVVSGHIRGKTSTMPLHIEILYNEYQFASAFAVASVLGLLAIISLILKTRAEWRAEQELRASSSPIAP
ncbi:MAG: sulfate ABC transporter permease subunit CysW [Proteobacteria bacterium]|nr:sulfate ABC transporter permease subunit CysW [Pseudomonadota bacterium]